MQDNQDNKELRKQTIKEIEILIEYCKENNFSRRTIFTLTGVLVQLKERR